jgi:cytochrome c oxidase cbb3-type subunit 2
MALTHEKIETSNTLLIILITLVVSIGGLVEIVPLFFQKSTTTPVNELVKPYDALRLAGRDIYIREGCYNCHSQMIRPFRAETERYGHYSVAGEYVYDHPFQWGSKRTGPDLHRVGGRYSDQWHRIHLLNPRDVVPESNMPAYYWLDRPLKDPYISAKMKRAAQGRRALYRSGNRRCAEGARRQDRAGCADRLPARSGSSAETDALKWISTTYARCSRCW